MNTLLLEQIPAFEDNYLWLLHNGSSAIVVDPGDPVPVAAKLAALGLTLDAILVTHHHADHVAGVDALRQQTGAVVYGPYLETLPEPLIRVGHGERLQLLGVEIDVLEVPGHTAGHIAFFVPESQRLTVPLLFCGDTLFSGGCGRLFEGTAAQMLASLTLLAALPGSTRVCCAHEYTLSNLRFARAVDPDNAALATYLAHCQQLRAQQLPTIPSTIELERQINPFLRTQMPSVQAAVLQQDPQALTDIEFFAALRQWKNTFT
jgi:hydroxyacylglutathione hydrolase